MPYAKVTDDLQQTAREVLAALHRSNNHPIPSTQGMTFAQIERRAHAVGQRIAAELTAEALSRAADEQSPSADCPTCTTTCRVKRQERTLRTLDGPLEYHEPVAHCVLCRRDFFPSASDVVPGGSGVQPGVGSPSDRYGGSDQVVPAGKGGGQTLV